MYEHTNRTRLVCVKTKRGGEGNWLVLQKYDHPQVLRTLGILQEEDGKRSRGRIHPNLGTKSTPGASDHFTSFLGFLCVQQQATAVVMRAAKSPNFFSRRKERDKLLHLAKPALFVFSSVRRNSLFPQRQPG